MQSITRPTLFLLLSTLLLAALPATRPAHAEVRLLASIQPLHSLATAITAGAARAELLLPAGSSPHNHALRPSQMRQLQEADLILWIGPQLEGSLIKPLTRLHPGQRLLTLSETEEIELLPLRHGGVWETAHQHHREENRQPGEGIDPHLWLDPDNAIRIGNLLARELSRIDPQQAATYQRNAVALRHQLELLSSDLRQQLIAVRTLPYLVFHDAYQYFERHFDLQPLGSISLDPEHQPGARRLAELRQVIRAHQVACICAEPQFPPRLVETLREGTTARPALLDPLGSDLPPGPGAYPQLLRNLADALLSCRPPQDPENLVD